MNNQQLYWRSNALLIYQTFLDDEPGRLWQQLLVADKDNILVAYGQWFCCLADRQLGWQDYLIQQLLTTDNPFTKQVQQTSWADLSAELQQAVHHDLAILREIYKCSCSQIAQWVTAATGLETVAWADHLPSKNPSNLANILDCSPDWLVQLPDLIKHYGQFGTGRFAQFSAFRSQQGELQGIADPDPIELQQLVGYSWQQAALLQNTQALVAGYPALNVLLYGSRGSGKSSLVKALVHEFENLRLIEVPKNELMNLPQILEQLRQLPQKFIIFVDDLSFEADEDSFKALKVVLEGGLVARPENIVVYATSNRRHLIREFFADRPRPQDSDEIHNWDTVQEQLSFSDRFGLTLTFEPANQETYLQIVHHLATGLDITAEKLTFRALQWATQQNGRSGRTARQFVDFLRSELAISR
jgi:predicted AAA+ superfamily ATPase